MTKAETFERAWRLGYKGDYSLVDEIYHPEYSAFEDTTGITANLEGGKTVVLSLRRLGYYWFLQVCFRE